MMISGFNETSEVIEICNYSNLEKLVLRKNTFQEVTTLRICKNEQLKTIEVEDSDEWETIMSNGACFDVNSIVIEGSHFDNQINNRPNFITISCYWKSFIFFNC